MRRSQEYIDRMTRYLASEGAINPSERITSIPIPENDEPLFRGRALVQVIVESEVGNWWPGWDFVVYESTECARIDTEMAQLKAMSYSTRYLVGLDKTTNKIADGCMEKSLCRPANLAFRGHSDMRKNIENALIFPTNQEYIEKLSGIIAREGLAASCR